jgi:transcriptional regulator with XRE-family HTH domain
LDMEAAERTAKELEECYFSDEDDLVVNKNARRKLSADEADQYSDYEEEEVEETLDDIIHLAEGDDGEEDPGHDLFEHYPESEEEDEQEEEYDDKDYDHQTERLNDRIGRHGDNLSTMRKSNFLLKSKIDRLFDILQMQREKHHDLNQELTRMLADIQ